MLRSAGDTLGNYSIQSLLGKGGMGEVYLARDRKLGRDVAIKTLPLEFAGDPERRTRFEREARILASLNHPNIAAIYGLEEADGDSFLVLELVDGETLAARLERDGPLPPSEALQLADQIAEALEAAHAKGITHRDIKPANIKITHDGRVKILDFGLAKAVWGGREAADLSEALTLTAGSDVGVILGTPSYMSPEQIRGQTIDQRSDIWAFGCVLYELLSGRRPFEGETLPDLVTAILSQEPDWGVLGTATPERARELVRRCLTKDPSERFQNITEGRAAIARAKAGSRILTRRTVSAIGLAAITLAIGLPITLNMGGLRDRLGIGGQRFRSIAVLPMTNLSGNPDQEYFSDGLTESLISDLARIGTLKVISRTSAMTYKGVKKPVREIAAELGVDAVLEGSAVRSGNQVRIKTQLIDARTDQLLWAETYDRNLADVLVVQSEVARAVAQQLRAQLTSKEQTRLASARAVNPEAYNAYLQGKFLVNRPNLRQNLDTAQRYFEFALEKDPDYALAHAGIAWVWVSRQMLRMTPRNEAGPKAVAAAEKALSLDGSLAEVWNTLGVMQTWVLWDYPTAESSFVRAIELDPNYPDSRVYYARLLYLLNRPAEAMPQIQKALEMDPQNALFVAHYANLLNASGRYDEAIVQARRALALDPSQQQARNQLSNAFLLKGNIKQAIELLIQSSKDRGDSEMVQVLQLNYDQGKYLEAARAAVDLREARWKNGTFPVGIGPLYEVANLPDKSLAFLEQTLGDGSDPAILDAVRHISRAFPQLLSNPRFQVILKRTRLP